MKGEFKLNIVSGNQFEYLNNKDLIVKNINDNYNNYVLFDVYAFNR